MATFTNRQCVVLILLIISKFLTTILWALQAPFYPAEAEKKNATLLESSIVLGTYEIMVFIMCPLIASQLPRIGAFRCFHLGFILCALSTILFGFLDKVDGRVLFISLSLILRVLEAIGSSTTFLATYTLSNRLYPGSVATVFALIESTFALGMAAGPPIGGFLFEVGSPHFGFTTPFLTVGTTMLVISFATYIYLPRDPQFQTKAGEGRPGVTESTVGITEVSENDEESEAPSFGFFGLLGIKKAALYAIVGMCASMCVGFLTGTLEPHLRQFNLTPFLTGVLFLTYGGVYAATAFFWGMLCDNIRRPEIVTLVCCLMVLISFVFVGPLTCIPLIPSVFLTGTSLGVFGLGLGGIYVSVYTLILKEAKLNGFPESSKTSALVAGLWIEGISLGAFIGPILGGSLLQHFGFPNATLSVIAIFTIISMVLTVVTLTQVDKEIISSISKSETS